MPHTVRALLDSGSQSSFITKKCQQRLLLPVTSVQTPIFGLNNISTSSSNAVRCTIKPHFGNFPHIDIDPFVINNICEQMPSVSLPINSWSHVRNLLLADPNFHIPGHIDLLLGAEVFASIVIGNKRVGKFNEPVAFETTLGWIVTGKLSCMSPSIQAFCCSTSSLDKTIRKFWEIEEVPQPLIQSSDDRRCEEIFVQNYSRTSSGRFVVTLPFNVPEPTFKNSKELATRRFFSLERRLIQNNELYKEYKAFMQDYLDRGHMSVIPVTEPETDRSFYIPHQCVLKPDSMTTKLRVVFDASAASPNSTSLNSTLFSGAKLQKDIFDLLLEFRLHRFVVTADIKQMYRQILIAPQHRDYQRILFRFNNSEPLREYRLNTVTYGVTAAPFLALRTLQELAKLEGLRFPLATQALQSGTYVDDIVSGNNTIENARQLVHELQELLKLGGFQLHKWNTNCSDVLSGNAENFSGPSDSNVSFDTDAIVKILGLKWQSQQDIFTYSVKPLDRVCSKRTILSELARVFDPLGFLAPLTFYAKCLIQQLWTLGLQWDETPPENILLKWRNYIEQLPLLAKFTIPRHLPSDNYVSIQLHGFSDASESGFSAVIYFRYQLTDNQVKTFLVCAKSKVAPIKRISLPRLELCGALLLAKLIGHVSKIYDNKIVFEKVYAWSDSTVALSWIKSSPHRWKSFVANRVTQIQDLVPPSNWYHIRSESNPADCASRGLLPADLVQHPLWFTGPLFLLSPENSWIRASGSHIRSSDAISAEEKKTSLVTTANCTESNFIQSLLDSTSSFVVVQRRIGFMHRFISNSRNTSEHRESGCLNSRELHNALLTLIGYVQRTNFKSEIENIKQKKLLTKSLQKLNLFLDSRGLVRVGGRLVNSIGLSYDQKHPLLLPQNHRFTELLIVYYHEKYLHVGAQTLHHLLRQSVWILGAKRIIRRMLSRCVRCFRVKPTSTTPLMGNLPYPRVNQLKPFLHTGIDFAGPISITTGKYRGTKTTKAYICLFVCLSVKAIHLELVSALTTEAFLAAFRRFVSRRGRCTDIYTDCGTNFIGANKVLIQYAHKAANGLEIKWHFNPPSAPNFGGIWESGVKAVKTHMIKVIGEQSLTYEEYYTLLVQIEAILNSRPLSPISSDPNDPNVLTPSHFLMLEPVSAPPDEDLSSIRLNRLNRWQLIQRCQQDFWKRYHREYLHTLQQRAKWFKPATNVQLGTIVIIKQDNAPPLQWRLGRIIQLHPGSDNISRVATIKTLNGVVQRPISKLCPLPTDNTM